MWFCFHQGPPMPGLMPNVGPGQPGSQEQQRPGTGSQGMAPRLPRQPSPTDMTAFNKLLGMMKQAGTLEQAQKEMVSSQVLFMGNFVR